MKIHHILTNTITTSNLRVATTMSTKPSGPGVTTRSAAAARDRKKDDDVSVARKTKAAQITEAMVDRIVTEKQRKPKKSLNLKDVNFLREQIKEYEQLPTSTWEKVSSCTSTTIQIVLIIILVLFSGIPTKLGVFRKIAEVVPSAAGQTPAFNYGLVPGYTFDQLDQLDLTGETALITGGNSGVGFETAKYLVKLGADVTILCRSEQRCEEAAKTIGGETNMNKISTIIADMSDLKNTREAVSKYAGTIEKLDMLFLNAGINSAGTNEDGSLPLSVDGIEKVFATNHVGHHQLWKLVAEKVKAAKNGRVVLTSSASSFSTYEYGVATDLETLNSVSVDQNTYGQSKLAQILWAQELTRQLGEDSSVYVNSYHPGCAATNIWFGPQTPKFLHGFMRFMQEQTMWSSLEGALTMLYLGAATNDLKEKNLRGLYFHPMVQKVDANPKFAGNLQLQKDVWTFSDELIKRG
jgi:NAD(P)-dependent dehydrogenase (short-subunit alcohol dehydrogenase family)